MKARLRVVLVVLVAPVALAACGGKGARPAGAPASDTAEAPAPPCTATDVVASWGANAGSDFEEITVAEDGGFSSYLHERPFYQGRWTLADGALILTTADGVTIRIDDVRCQYTSLTGRSDGATVEWTAIQPGAM